MRQSLYARTSPALMLAVVFSFATACKSGRDRTSTDPDPVLWQAEQPFQAADRSLAPEVYRAMGLAAFERNWTSEEMKEAAAQLQIIAKKDPGELPRYHSGRSGSVFERIAHPGNLAALGDASLPISIRLAAAADYSSAIDAIVRIYLAALSERAVSGGDVTELYAAQLRTCEAVMKCLDEFLPTLSPSDPSYSTRMAALDKIRMGLGEIVIGIVRALSEPRFFGYQARKRLLEYCAKTFDGIVPRLPITAREALLDQLTTASSNGHLANLQPQLNTLRDRVAYLVSSGKGFAAPTGSRP